MTLKDRDRESIEWLGDRVGLKRFPKIEREAWIKAGLEIVTSARTEGTAYRPNLPPLFAVDDWLWVAQSLGYVPFSGDDAGFAEHHRMDRIIAKIIEYRAEDVRRESGE